MRKGPVAPKIDSGCPAKVPPQSEKNSSAAAQREDAPSSVLAPSGDARSP